MNPISLLRSGIEHGDWEDVIHAFALLTGETLKAPAQGTNPRAEKAYELLEEFHRKASDLLGLEGWTEPFDEVCEDHQEVFEDPLGLLNEPKPEPTVPAVETINAEEPQEWEAPPDPFKKVDPFEKFKVNNGGPAGDKKYGRREPHTPPKGPNQFKDDGKLAKKDIAESRALSEKKGARSGPERPKFTEIDLTCSSCRRTFRVHPDLRPRKLDSEDNEPLWSCDSCIGRRRG